MNPTIDDREWVAERLAAGDTVQAIGLASGVSRQTATAWIKRHGLQANNTRALKRPTNEQLTADYAKTATVRALAALYDVSAATAQRWLFEAGVDTRPAGARSRITLDTVDIAQRRAAGETWKNIAKHYGVSTETIRRAHNSTATRSP